MFARRRALVVALVVACGTTVTPVAASALPHHAKPSKPPKPAVSKVKPDRGPLGGGTVVKIKGRHLAGAKKVLFGKAKGTKLKVRSDHRLSVVAPAATVAGPVVVRVVTKGGKSKASKKAVFTYVGSPTTPPPPSNQAPLPADAAADPAVYLLAVDCPAAGACVAVGYYDRAAGGTYPLIETLANGTWTASSPPLPAGAVTSGQVARVTTLDCASTSDCVAVGGFTTASGFEPLVEQLQLGVWTAVAPGLPAGATATVAIPLVSVACPSATSCVAVGNNGKTGTFGGEALLVYQDVTWHNQAAPLPAGEMGSKLVDVECTAVGTCMAVGQYFTATDRRGLAESLASGTFTPTVLPVPGDAAALAHSGSRALSCPSVGSCTSAGFYEDTPGHHQGLVNTWSGGSWTATRIAPPAGSATDPEVTASSISCSGAASCALDATYKRGDGSGGTLVATVGVGSPVVTVIPLPGAAANPDAAAARLLCSAPSSCTAVGGYRHVDGLFLPAVVRIVGGTPSTTTAVTPPGAHDSALIDLAVVGPGTAVSVGYFKDSSGHNQGLIVNGVGI